MVVAPLLLLVLLGGCLPSGAIVCEGGVEFCGCNSDTDCVVAPCSYRFRTGEDDCGFADVVCAETSAVSRGGAEIYEEDYEEVCGDRCNLGPTYFHNSGTNCDRFEPSCHQGRCVGLPPEF